MNTKNTKDRVNHLVKLLDNLEDAIIHAYNNAHDAPRQPIANEVVKSLWHTRLACLHVREELDAAQEALDAILELETT